MDLGAALPAGATAFRRAAQGEQLSSRDHAGGGDFNGDGRDDPVFGASTRQAGSDAFPNTARTFVVRGSALPQ